MNTKKIFIILISVFLTLLFASCESNDTATNAVYIPQAVNKKVLVEYFSNSSCQPCIAAHDNFIDPVGEQLGVTKNDTAVVFISWQYKYPNINDSIYWQNPVQNAYRANYYQVFGAPNGQLDGNYMGDFAQSSWTNQVNTEFYKTKYVNISLVNTYDTTLRNGSITANVTTLVSPGTSDNVIHFILTESKVHYVTAQNGITLLNDCMRQMITDTTGSPITLSGTTSQTKSYNIQTKFNDTNCNIVVFIQSVNSKKVYGVEKIKVR